MSKKNKIFRKNEKLFLFKGGVKKRMYHQILQNSPHLVVHPFLPPLQKTKKICFLKSQKNVENNIFGKMEKSLCKGGGVKKTDVPTNAEEQPAFGGTSVFLPAPLKKIISHFFDITFFVIFYPIGDPRC